MAARGTVPDGLAFSLAALIRFVRGTDSDGRFVGARGRGAYPIRDDRAALEAINAAGRRRGSDMAALAREVLGDAAIWGEDLNNIGDLAERTGRHLGRIEADGVRAALAAI